MKILILGGHGFIGHHTAKQLKDIGHTVSIVDCHHQYGEFSDWEYHPVMQQKLDYIGEHEFFLNDVTNQWSIDSIFASVQPDVVIDLATYPNAKMVKKNVVDATENMITATAIALDLCVKYKVSRFVLASSSMVYGDFGGKTPDETTVCSPLTLYGSYKLQCETMCKIWHKEHGLEYAILRPSALYGTRDMVVRAISKMTVSALTQGRMEVNGPTNRLDFSWVEDVANAFVVAALDPLAANEIFNCTRGNGRTILEAAEIIQSRISADIVQLPHDSFYPNRDTLNSDKLKTLTRWNPTVDIETGINLYLDWFLKQPYLSQF
jgi:nucleoside-diphosphate-sugar epimerase